MSAKRIDPFSKLALAERMRGAHEAENSLARPSPQKIKQTQAKNLMCTFGVREDLSTEATKQGPARVEFPKRILSGIQSTGSMHLGNYLGFVQNNINFIAKERCEAFLFIADLHAITMPQDPDALRRGTIEAAALYQACGLTPDICHVFVQSQVLEHAELAWILGCYTSMGELNRMTQFKEKSEQFKASGASLGLYSYPVLMAADILIYQASHVPVGDDQKQHLEMTRNIAQSFNHGVGSDFFRVPEPVILSTTKRIMSLRDGTKKMSKSDESDYARINLIDSPDEIRKKIAKAKTDAMAGLSYVPSERPEVSNLIGIYAGLADISTAAVVQKFEGQGCAAFKKDLADLIISSLEPIRTRFDDIMKHQDHILDVLAAGRAAAQAVASQTLQQAKELVGFLCLRK